MKFIPAQWHGEDDAPTGWGVDLIDVPAPGFDDWAYDSADMGEAAATEAADVLNELDLTEQAHVDYDVVNKICEAAMANHRKGGA